jgi:hypothetical protein
MVQTHFEATINQIAPDDHGQATTEIGRVLEKKGRVSGTGTSTAIRTPAHSTISNFHNTTIVRSMQQYNIAEFNADIRKTVLIGYTIQRNK